MKWMRVAGLLLAVAAVLSSGSGRAAAEEPEEAANPEAVNPDGWILRWADEFDGPASAAPDARYWTIETGEHGFGGEELQTYTDQVENIGLDGQGHLVLTARREDFGGYTSARIHTRDKLEFRYGAVEVRARMPAGDGLGPAIWTGGFGKGVPWPLCGERDIVEIFGHDASRAVSTLMGASKESGRVLVAQSESYAFPEGEDATCWHVYRHEYRFSPDDRPEEMRFYVDGRLYRRARPDWFPGQWVFAKYKHFIVMNIAVGGDRPWGQPTDATDLPQSMIVDYVRFYDVKN